MITLVEFVEARLAEDQARAEAAATNGPPRAARGVWTYRDGSDAVWYDDTGQDVFTGASWGGTYLDDTIGEHIARHDPARVLREVEAKRATVALAKAYADEQFPDHSGGYASATEDVVALLAAPYADHLDYRAEWAPA